MPRQKGKKPEDITGKQFGEWVVLSKGIAGHWVCRCICGNEKQVHVHALKFGKSKSCGCKGKDWCKSHGKTNIPEYYVWAGMLQRCTNTKHKWFHRYGGRGIKVCERWKKFEDFYADMGKRPVGHKIERINNDGNYEPSNCKWASQTEQIRNRGNTIFLEYEGITRSLAEWAELYGIKRKVLANRIKQGWTVFDALTKPKSGRWGTIRSKPIQD